MNAESAHPLADDYGEDKGHLRVGNTPVDEGAYHEGIHGRIVEKKDKEKQTKNTINMNHFKETGGVIVKEGVY